MRGDRLSVPKEEVMVRDTANKEMTVFTIGHSNHPIETFLDLLKQSEIKVVVDVRSSPHLRYATHFNKDEIQRSLKNQNITYLFLGDAIGGRPTAKGYYDDEGHVLYNYVAESKTFKQGIRRLMSDIAAGRVAILCSEEDPTDCHRRLLIGRVLRENGTQVLHIRGDGRVQSEEDVAREEEFRKTGGQLSLFEDEEAEQWKSTQSVLQKKAPNSSSTHSDEQE
jgi:uncharacterized protein (DUF488 family)